MSLNESPAAQPLIHLTQYSNTSITAAIVCRASNCVRVHTKTDE